MPDFRDAEFGCYEVPRKIFEARPPRCVALPIIHAENDISLSSGKVLNAGRGLIGKPHRLKIYPPIGDDVDEGRDFLKN
jgi:hypothetical protein